MWMKPDLRGCRAFKFSGAESLFSDYLKRMGSFASSHVAGRYAAGSFKSREECLWVCDGRRGSTQLSSMDVSDHLKRLQNSGIKSLRILIGGADGFSGQDFKDLAPDLRWSFGPLTLPHEFAAAVAAEQIYRAFTIIHSHPYHTEH